MIRTRTWVVTSMVTAVAVVLAAAVAAGGAQEPAALGHQTHTHAHARLSVPLGLESTVSHPEPGSTLLGGKTVSHFEAGRGSRAHRGTGGGRTFYTGAEAIEPTLGIDKKGNIFFQAQGSGPAPKVVVSRDDGRSWDDVTPALHNYSADPFIYVDKDTGRVFTADLAPEFLCLTVSHTDDAAKSWTSSKACGLTDHQNVFTGPPVSSSTNSYPNIVYICAMDIGATSVAAAATSCLKSIDGGITWVRTGAPAYSDDPRQGGGQHDVPGHCGGGTGHGFVDSKGIVYLPRGWCAQPYLAISKDEGATWERVQVADIGMAQLEDGIPCACTNYYEHEAAAVVDDRGNIYYFWIAKDRLPYLVISRDGGESFSEPMMVGRPGLREAWGPTMDIGATGKIALAYVGSTNAPGGKVPDGRGPEYTDAVTWNGYITTSVDALSKRPRFFTTTVNPTSDPIMRGECGIDRCSVQLDFIDIVIDPDGRPWTSMVDGCWPPPGDGCGAAIGTGFVGTVVGGPKLR